MPAGLAEAVTRIDVVNIYKKHLLLGSGGDEFIEHSASCLPDGVIQSYDSAVGPSTNIGCQVRT